jgi:hypothetical protein
MGFSNFLYFSDVYRSGTKPASMLLMLATIYLCELTYIKLQVGTWELAPTARQCDGAGSALSRGWSSSSSFTADRFSDLSSSQITSTNKSVCVHSMFGHVTFNTFVVIVHANTPCRFVFRHNRSE